MNYIYSTVNTLRDRYTPVATTSTFRKTGEINPNEFEEAGDYLVSKFPTWSWGDADDESRRVPFLPPGSNRRRRRASAGGDDDDDGWLRTGGLASSQPLKAREIRAVDEAGNVAEGQVVEDDEIPDMEDEEDDDAIIKDTGAESKSGGRRTYNLYIMYSPYYRTPRLYLSGYSPNGQPLPPKFMMDDIVGDYKDKTVTLEDFPFFANNIKMASEKLRAAAADQGSATGADTLVEEVKKLDVKDAEAEADKAEDWEEVQQNEIDDQEVAIRVDQYLVVFLKFMASVTPGIEHDFTMGV
ncbi:unnamed protein product [Parascedosporium putredinis]|uniref:Autophagy-related protein 3 n=1 Tax=Parascedosporium putredinis TaxID=1442378 RepID=A0A9P1H9A2_9PEZI|nr:unnamed protein product [Parascedosporium putredinis]CAI8001461.1 unnamed protein product [Parascedosporium putredinis]